MSNNDSVTISENISTDDERLDITLRPQQFGDFIGQQKVKDNIEIAVRAAQLRNEAVDHILIYGPPGLGKTTLAHIIANQMNSNIKVTSGPAIERGGDLASILTNLDEGDVLFIDEIHRLNKNVEEILYPAMEDKAIDLVIGKGPAAKTMRLELPNFTLVGATTRIGSISSPMRDRFGLVHRLDYYDQSEISDIINRSAKILDIEIDNPSLNEISKRSRFTPRIANRLLKRVRDYAQVKTAGEIKPAVVKLALEMLEIDSLGLDKSDRLIIETINSKFAGGPVGIKTISAATGEEEQTICDVNEPYLIRIGFIKRTPQGRVLTDRAMEHLG